MVYDKRTGIKSNSDYMADTHVALGSFAPYDFFESLAGVCEKVLEQCSLEDFSDTLLTVGSSVGGIAQKRAVHS